MHFVSTRGGPGEAGFVDVVFGGLAPDGGLWMPARIPPIMADDGSRPAASVFPDLVAATIAPFASGAFSRETLCRIAKEAYSPARFPHEAIAPLIQIGPDDWLLELFHGPSLAFKDFALAMTGAIWDEWLGQRHQRVTALVATSGDTGGAAAAALAGKRNIELVILHPLGRISEVQRRFMTGLSCDNILNLAVEADFDACQALVKTLLAERPVPAQGDAPQGSGGAAGEFRFSAVNSINWLRIATQAAYFCHVGQVLRRPFDVIVPTGNFGNGFSALVARAMGAPVGRILAACNENDFIHRFIDTGALRRDRSRATLAPAMDIQVPSNLERVLWLAMGEAGQEVAGLYAEFERVGHAPVPKAAHEWICSRFDAARATDDEILATMKHVHRATGQVLCPHSAAGLAGAHKMARRSGPAAGTARVVLATAHPAKFPETVARATGVTTQVPERAAAVLTAEERLTVVPNEPRTIRNAIHAFLARQRV